MNLPHLTETGFPPENTIFHLSSFRLRVVDDPHPWVVENEEEIRRNWEREVAANPHLFNGRMVFQRHLSFSDGHIEGTGHLVPYAAFLHWRRAGRGQGGHHLFSMPLILSADGAVVAARMAETTSSPGRVYPPCGSLDASDVKDGLCDLYGNIWRETMEETGLDLDSMEMEPGYRAVHVDNTVSIFRVFRSRMTEAEFGAWLDRHNESESEPELSALIGIRSADPRAHDYPAFMPAVLDWVFNSSMGRGTTT